MKWCKFSSLTTGLGKNLPFWCLGRLSIYIAWKHRHWCYVHEHTHIHMKDPLACISYLFKEVIPVPSACCSWSGIYILVQKEELPTHQDAFKVLLRGTYIAGKHWHWCYVHDHTHEGSFCTKKLLEGSRWWSLLLRYYIAHARTTHQDALSWKELGNGVCWCCNSLWRTGKSRYSKLPVDVYRGAPIGGYASQLNVIFYLIR